MGFFTKKVIYANFPKLDPELRNETDIVGESFHQETLAAMSLIPLSPEASHWVALRPEPNNPHDNRAIRVDWVKPDGSGWLTCGHIARAETESWHTLLASTPKGTVWVWPATVMGGTEGKFFGLYFSW